MIDLSPCSDSLRLFISRLGASVSGDGTERKCGIGESSGLGESLPSISLATLPSLALFRLRFPLAHSKSSVRAQYNFFEPFVTPLSTFKANRTWPKEGALRNLSTPLIYKGVDLLRAPTEMAGRVLDSFAFLVIANLRQFFKIQLQRHEQTGDAKNLTRARYIATSFMGSIKNGNEKGRDSNVPLDITSVSTSFGFSEDAMGQEKKTAEPNIVSHNIIFKMEIKVSIHRISSCIQIEIPGNLCAIIEPDTHSIQRVHLLIEEDKLLRSMRSHARFIVLKAVTLKDFPVIQALEETQAPSSKTDRAPKKPSKDMYKLALCASLELASLISSDEATHSEQQREPRQNKRRLSGVSFFGQGNRHQICIPRRKMQKVNHPILNSFESGSLLRKS